MRIERERLYIFLLYQVVFVLLGISYCIYISEIWRYENFDLEVNLLKIAISSAILILYSLSFKMHHDSRVIFNNIVICLKLIPSLVLFSFAGFSYYFILLICISVGVVFFVSGIPLARFRLLKIKGSGTLWLMAIAATVVTVSYGVFGGFQYFNLDIRDVYEFRRDAAEALPAIYRYISSAISKVTIPFGIILSIYYRKYSLASLFIVISIIIFGFTSHKSVIFFGIAPIIIYTIFNNVKKFSTILSVYVIIIAISFIDSELKLMYWDNNLFLWYTSILIRRALLVPAFLDNAYIQFFSENPYLLWSQSSITLGLVSDPYSVSAPYIIGEVALNSPGTHANTGFIGSGYAQAGVAGVVLYSIGVGLVFAILRSYERLLGMPVIVSMSLPIIVTMLLSADFVTMFLTHGLLFALVFLAILSSNGEAERRGVLRPRPARLQV